jgi:hypothetical protein
MLRQERYTGLTFSADAGRIFQTTHLFFVNIILLLQIYFYNYFYSKCFQNIYRSWSSDFYLSFKEELKVHGFLFCSSFSWTAVNITGHLRSLTMVYKIVRIYLLSYYNLIFFWVSLRHLFFPLLFLNVFADRNLALVLFLVLDVSLQTVSCQPTL